MALPKELTLKLYDNDTLFFITLYKGVMWVICSHFTDMETEARGDYDLPSAVTQLVAKSCNTNAKR